MIQKKVIDTIYRKFKNRPASPDELNIPLLFEKLPEQAGVEIDGDNIVLNNVNTDSPFHMIPVGHIHAIVEFDEAIAIVLHSSIIFISKTDGKAHVHLREINSGLFDRLRHFVGRQAVL